MIVYELRCAAGHGFEAWFRNSESYDQQHAAHQISCPICGDGGVSKAPMAPRIGRSDRALREAAQERRQEKQQEQPSAGQAPSHQVDPEQMRMVMSKIAELNKHIADTCDYVGNAFAEEARKIHYGETEHREIYGETSPTEAAELREEGISIATVPWIRRSDS
jgi:hypothetical protein